MTKEFIFNGIVQGIGFRPTVQRIANELGITGEVSNRGGSVRLVASGKKEALDKLIRRLEVLFEINSFEEIETNDKEFELFSIVHSEKDNHTPFLTPDLATCADCEKELFDKNNRRYGHPFISCVNCGARYSIIKELPYDRENTTMSEFDMCEECSDEYTNPSDRRCHAQTIACNDCGPATNIDIVEAVKILKSGDVLAIKDIGGYHLACRTDKSDAVARLREIKGREKKPFAVMFYSLSEIKDYCKVSKKEEALLTSPARPIVLLKKKKNFEKNICGESEYIGAFLPCNPIQLMILSEVSPLVMTSANISGEPIITDDEEIKKFRVKILSHNREIMAELDDSVLKVCAGRTQFIRRARGYTPLAVNIGVKAKKDTLLLGGDLKSEFGFHRDNYVFLSQQLGDLDDAKVYDAYQRNIKRFSRLHSFKSDITVSDMHPAYRSANMLDADIKVQHHKAHCASVIAEHRLKGDVLCFAFDATGYGDDGAIWGSEVFTFDGRSFERIKHLDYVKLLSSDEVAKNADIALSCYLRDNDIINKAIDSNISSVLSSSMGRLFDAMSALLDIKHTNTFEGECAQALERCAKKADKAYTFKLTLSPVDILNQAKKAMECGEEKSSIALGFHMLICDIICNTVCEVKTAQIVLSGGTFLNEIITETVITKLEADGFRVYINEKVPCGDAGLALGQAFIAALEV